MSSKRFAAWLSIGAASLGLAVLGSARVGDNFRAVVEGRVYRSGQLSPKELESRIERHGIRSLVNLRGEKENREWYREELEVARRHGVELRSLDLLPERLPSRPAVVALIDHLESLPEPILIHCSAGADRTGFASVIARMAKGDAPVDQARSELSFWYGHFPFGPATEIGRIFDLYDAYRRRSGKGPSFRDFEHWAREIYVPYVYSAQLRALAFPSEAASGERLEVRVRVENTSPGPWLLTHDLDRGIKLGVRLRKSGEAAWLDYDRHGNQDGALDPGQELELSPPIFAPASPGSYEIKLDMVDEHVTWFEDQGSKPLVLSLEVRDSEADPRL
jgi:protein tyrosine/serine phosphatase